MTKPNIRPIASSTVSEEAYDAITQARTLAQMFDVNVKVVYNKPPYPKALGYPPFMVQFGAETKYLNSPDELTDYINDLVEEQNNKRIQARA